MNSWHCTFFRPPCSAPIRYENCVSNSVLREPDVSARSPAIVFVNPAVQLMCLFKVQLSVGPIRHVRPSLVLPRSFALSRVSSRLRLNLLLGLKPARTPVV